MFRHRMFFLFTLIIIIASSAWAQSGGQVSMSQLAMPESMVYVLLRGRGTDSTEQRANLERNLQLMRAYAHDHRRQVDQRWLTPLEFARRRQAFKEVYQEAQNHFRQATPKRNATHREKLAQSRHRAAGEVKLRQAAGAWADPVLRRFLLGIAALNEKDFSRAESLFSQCLQDEPRIVAFYQGRAQALMGLKRYSEALRAYMQILAMAPDSREAISMLQQTMQNVPGSNIETPAFREAKAMLEAYKSNRPSRAGISTAWLLPGKAVRTKENALPDLTMDRFVVRQALGVPIAEHTLLVDSRVLQNADQVLVQINPQTLAPVSKRRSSRQKGNQAAVTWITVPDYKFTPLQRLYGDPNADDLLTLSTVNVYTEMGSEIRQQPVKVLAGENGYTTDPTPALANGESAGILLTDKDELAGVVVRDLDVMKDSPQQDVYVTPDLEDLLKKIKKRSSRRRSKRTIRPVDAPGKVFTVYAIQGERFEDK